MFDRAVEYWQKLEDATGVSYSSERAAAMATRAGGFVGGDQRHSADSDAVAELELRVPAAKFTDVV